MTDLGNKALLMVGGHDQFRSTVHDVYIFHTGILYRHSTLLPRLLTRLNLADTESWSKLGNAGGLHDAQRSAHRAVLAGNAYVSSGGYKKTYIPTFSFFDIRMITYDQPK